ncbi:MAG: LptF/LptG family permease [Armatimonadota bacterium]
MKIIDRYILTAITASFLFGLAMFLALLMAMNLLRELIEMISVKGIPVEIALKIFAYSIPNMLVYAFPMSVLLSILLVFNRMSADSEMVAIRAGGTSFVRIVVPTLFFALAVTGLTFWVSDVIVPFASKRAVELRDQALREMKTDQYLAIPHVEKGRMTYSFIAASYDAKRKVMRKLNLVVYDKEGLPLIFVFSPKALWDPDNGHWIFSNGIIWPIDPDKTSIPIIRNPDSPAASIDLTAYAMIIKENPLDIEAAKKNPEEFTAVELRQYIERLKMSHQPEFARNRMELFLWNRYSVPFTCLIFALIGAPLGLRHHRTSSAMGLGISLLVIFFYYTFFNYLNMIGRSGQLSAPVASWLPIGLGTILGIVLIIRANK